MRSYKPPKDVRQRKRDKEYAATQPRVSLINRELKANVTGCQTIIGGTRVWKRGKRTSAPYDKYAFPIIVGGERCNEPATTSKREDGRNVHRCAKHQGIDWVKTT